jgi:predicted membrane protein
MPISDLLWAAALGAEIMGLFLLMVYICIGAWDSYKDKKRRDAAKKVLREAKEAEAASTVNEDKFFKEVQAYYDSI